MAFRIHRLVLAQLDTSEQDAYTFTDEESGVTVRRRPITRNGRPDESSTALFQAMCEIPELDEHDGLVQVPARTRRSLEGSIERHVNLLSVLSMKPRQLTSPMPYIALEGIDERSQNWLQGKKIEVSLSAGRVRAWYDLKLSDALPLLKDRQDGVALIAESLAHDHSTGRLHELIRLFERAFGLAAGKVCRNQLPQFLSGNGRKFEKKEVVRWLTLRDSSSHADRTSNFALQADTNSVVNRMELAAYDVLLNKKCWNNRSTERRQTLTPLCGPADAESGLFLTQGREAQISINTFDGFASYPLNMLGSLTKVPDRWLTEFADGSNNANLHEN